MAPALSDDLRARVLTSENLGKAWPQVKATPGAPGVDGMSSADVPALAREHWPSSRQAWRDEAYHPAPARRISWSQEACQDFHHRLRKLTGRSWGVARTYRLRQLNAYPRGWWPYFGLSQYYRPLPELEAWVRRCLRMCFWKHWRYVRTTVRELLKLGPAKKTALLTARSRKGPWPLSRTWATQTGMTHQWLSESRGLVSIRALGIALHSPT